jgi:predicted PurR-regulated permease PerM
MEITSFVLGVLTVIGVAVAILVVLGMVKINKQKETINQLERSIELVENNSNRWIMQLEEQMCRNFDDIRREYSSYVDSRIDKLQSNKKEATTK